MINSKKAEKICFNMILFNKSVIEMIKINLCCNENMLVPEECFFLLKIFRANQYFRK